MRPAFLLPLFRLVFPLIESCREAGFQISQGIYHRLHVDLRALALRQGLEFAGLLGSRHIQVVEKMVNRSVEVALLGLSY